MSAIFGIIDFEGRPIDPAWIKSMQTDLAHRGPDGQGLYQEESMFLGHMLLQVTPESVYDKSPYEEDGFVITANARLDEREAIMKRLDIPSNEWEIITDPLLLLRSFIKFGKDFVKDIYGDFSFAIWDKKNKELFCARDQIGVKPFLYYFQGNRFAFSTELKAIVRLSFIKTEVDHNYLRNRVIAIWDEPEKTVWKNISRLKPAHSLLFNNLIIKTKQYWKPKYKRNKKFKNEEDSATALRIILEKVIHDQTKVLGEVGATLSGGLDSSTIVCLTARKLKYEGKKLVTASSIYKPGFSDPENPDEIEYINAILHQEQNIAPTFVHHTDLSFIQGLNQKFDRHLSPINGFYYVDEALYKKFYSKSIRRVLTGYLGDFTTSNNTINPFINLFYSGRYATLYKLILQNKRNKNQSIISIIKSKIVYEFTPRFIKNTWNIIKGNKVNPWDIKDLPLKLKSKEQATLQNNVLRSFNISSNNTRDLAKNIWPMHFDLFEEDWDCGSSYYQIEMTYPLADRRIIELLLQIPVEHFFANGIKRGLIKKAMCKVLPDNILRRENKGNYSPGYPNIIINNLKEINIFIDEIKNNNKLNHFIDFEKLKSKLKYIEKLNKNGMFVYYSWTLIELVIWIYYNQYITNCKNLSK